jgi:hypothetical protein
MRASAAVLAIVPFKGTVYFFEHILMMTRAVVGVRFETKLELGGSRAFRRGKRGAVQARSHPTLCVSAQLQNKGSSPLGTLSTSSQIVLVIL